MKEKKTELQVGRLHLKSSVEKEKEKARETKRPTVVT
jgi:hypothetical protein